MNVMEQILYSCYKNFDSSTDPTVELIDKTTGNIVEAKIVTATNGTQKFAILQQLEEI